MEYRIVYANSNPWFEQHFNIELGALHNNVVSPSKWVPVRWDDCCDDTANAPYGDHSRRSSLKSTSILGMEGEDAQGPTHTLNPLDGVQGADKSSDGTFNNYPTILLH